MRVRQYYQTHSRELIGDQPAPESTARWQSTGDNERADAHTTYSYLLTDAVCSNDSEIILSRTHTHTHTNFATTAAARPIGYQVPTQRPVLTDQSGHVVYDVTVT